MKLIKVSTILSGASGLLLGILLLAGLLPYRNVEASILTKGNHAYQKEDYDSAETIYTEGLANVPGSAALAYNLGLTQYAKKNYTQAVEQFTAAKADALVIGNTYYALGQQQTGDEQMKSYQAAVDAYYAGILNEPERFDLKFNYEFVKNLIDQQNQDQQNQDQQNQDQQNQDQQNQDQQNQDQQNQDQQNQDQQNQDQQNQDQQNQDQQNQDQQNQDQQQSTGGSEQDQQAQQDQSAINQILQALEQQEINSLKNNQEIIEKGTVDGHDW